MNSISLVIFDMDGVLADSEPMYREMNMDFIRRRGGDVSNVCYDQYVGSHAWDMWADLKEKFSLPESIEELVDLEKQSKHQLLHTVDLKAVPGAVNLVRSLKSEGFLLAVASSSLRVNVELVLDRLGLRKYFDHVVTGDDVVNGKPAPDIFLRAAHHFGIPPERCSVIEDSSNGILAAKRAGMRAIALSSHTSGNQELGRADIIVNDLEKISTAMFRPSV